MYGRWFFWVIFWVCRCFLMVMGKYVFFFIVVSFVIIIIFWLEMWLMFVIILLYGVLLLYILLVVSDDNFKKGLLGFRSCSICLWISNFFSFCCWVVLCLLLLVCEIVCFLFKMVKSFLLWVWYWLKLEEFILMDVLKMLVMG